MNNNQNLQTQSPRNPVRLTALVDTTAGRARNLDGGCGSRPFEAAGGEWCPRGARGPDDAAAVCVACEFDTMAGFELGQDVAAMSLDGLFAE
jgi:hypothetical protein